MFKVPEWEESIPKSNDNFTRTKPVCHSDYYDVFCSII